MMSNLNLKNFRKKSRKKTFKKDLGSKLEEHKKLPKRNKEDKFKQLKLSKTHHQKKMESHKSES